MSLSLDLNLLSEHQIGKDGLGIRHFEELLPKVQKVHQEMTDARTQGGLAFMNLVLDDAQLDDVAKVSSKLSHFENVVVMGIGGSSLGAKALFAGLCHPFHNLLPTGKRKAPRLFFPDNSDPSTFTALIETLDIESTAFLAVTKSGGTAETWAQLQWVIAALGNEKARKQIVAVTDPTKGALRAAVKHYDWESLPVPPAVGGRFSVFSPVGLLPAKLVGIDIGALIDGAASMLKRCETPVLFQNPAYMLAGALFLMDSRLGRNVHVFMPYLDALRETADWFVQLWAESLGKAHVNGHFGPTPVRSVGATDQHSLLQLLMEGPDDKCTIFVTADKPRQDVTIPRGGFDHSEVSYLSGHSMHHLLLTEHKATAAALAKRGRPSLTIRMPQLDAHHMGELLMLLEIATAFAGGLQEVNAFDQPGVEAGKRYTCGLLGRPGYEEAKVEFEALPKNESGWIF